MRQSNKFLSHVESHLPLWRSALFWTRYRPVTRPEKWKYWSICRRKSFNIIRLFFFSLGIMSGSSRQHIDFVNSPMKQKRVSQLPGIGFVLGGRLIDAGITRAYHVFGKFLVLDKDRIAFYEWLRGFGADDGQCTACFNALDEWCKRYLDWRLELSVDLRRLQRLYTIYIEFVMSTVSTVLALSWE